MVLREPLFGQELVSFDSFGTSLKFGEAPIYIVVGGISEIHHHFLPVIASWKSSNHRKRPTTKCSDWPFQKFSHGYKTL